MSNPLLQSQIPEFASREEEAAFWDTHDFTDYENELSPVAVEFAPDLSEIVTIRLSPEMLTRLRRQAQTKGLQPSALAQLWVAEHLLVSDR